MDSLVCCQYHRASSPSPSPLPTVVFDHMTFVSAKRFFQYLEHRHPRYEIILAEEGLYRCELNGVALTLSPGRGVAVKPGDLHHDYCEPGVRYLALSLHLEPEVPEPSPLGLFSPSVWPEGQVFAATPEVFDPILQALRRQSDLGGPLASPAQDALAQAFVWNMLRVLPRQAVNEELLNPGPNRVFEAKLKGLFRTNLGRGLLVAEMAAGMGLSERSLTQKCHAILGRPPAQAFRLAQMEEARKIIRQGGQKIATVAKLFGFHDPYHFSRAFKRSLGLAPSTVRSSPSP